MGYEITTLEDKSKRDKEDKKYIPDPIEAFKAIPTLTPEEINNLQIKQRSDPSEEDKDIIDKYFLIYIGTARLNRKQKHLFSMTCTKTIIKRKYSKI